MKEVIRIVKMAANVSLPVCVYWNSKERGLTMEIGGTVTISLAKPLLHWVLLAKEGNKHRVVSICAGATALTCGVSPSC